MLRRGRIGPASVQSSATEVTASSRGKAHCIAVPWPVMPGTEIDKRDVLGAGAGIQPAQQCSDAPFGY